MTKSNVVHVDFRKRQVFDAKARAYELYMTGCVLDEEDGTLDQAEAAYRAALALDPGLLQATVNLGNVLWRADRVKQAEALWRSAARQGQPEAAYNLGFSAHTRGYPAQAVKWFVQALKGSTGLTTLTEDAHFNLAQARFELEEYRSAQKHWETYLKLAPKGEWAEQAKRRIAMCKERWLGAR